MGLYLVKVSKPIVAMYGGSFNPPHLGHQSIVQGALKVLDIAEVLVVPTYLNPFKTSSWASANQRLQWCHTLFDSQDKVRVIDYEVKEGQSTPTSQTVKHLNLDYTVRYLIIGSDNLTSLRQWHNFEWLNEMLIWVIVTREGYPLEVAGLREWKILPCNVPISSSEIRAKKDLHYVDKKIKKSVTERLKDKNQ